MTMESKARENQRIAGRVERSPERGTGDAGVEIGVSANQKTYFPWVAVTISRDYLRLVGAWRGGQVPWTGDLPPDA